MKLKYLGTAAAEGVPGLFCNCPVCKKTRELKGRNYRSRSQTLINDDLLIDFGPDTYFHVCRYDIDLTKIRCVLITHGHDDHLLSIDLHYRDNGFAYINGDFDDEDKDVPPLNLYISKASSKLLTEELFSAPYIKVHVISPFTEYTEGQYKFIPLEAKHSDSLDPMMYILSDGEKTILYAHDTGRFPESTVNWLTENKPHFDFVSLDCTGMIEPCGTRHMGLKDNIAMKELLTDIGCADDKTVWCCNHFSHNGRCTHDEFVPIAAKEGFLAAYDGMETEI